MFRRSGLAAWLLLTVLGTAVSGCLFPQDDQMFPDLPPKRNEPPRFLESTVKPPQVTTLFVKCPMTSFDVYVEDPDLADRIRSRWVVDSRVDNAFNGRALEASSLPRRSTPVVSPASLTAEASPLAVAGEHQLTVVIADGEFSEGFDALPRRHALPDGGTIDDPSYTASFTWRVTTNLGPCPEAP